MISCLEYTNCRVTTSELSKITNITKAIEELLPCKSDI